MTNCGWISRRTSTPGKPFHTTRRHAPLLITNIYVNLLPTHAAVFLPPLSHRGGVGLLPVTPPRSVRRPLQPRAQLRRQERRRRRHSRRSQSTEDRRRWDSPHSDGRGRPNPGRQKGLLIA